MARQWTYDGKQDKPLTKAHVVMVSLGRYTYAIGIDHINASRRISVIDYIYCHFSAETLGTTSIVLQTY
jgi:hypothetical protein